MQRASGIAALLALSLLSQGLADPIRVYQPKLTNSKPGSHHDFPLGVLSATGRLVDGDQHILIKDVGKGGTADRAGIQVGDRIYTINGQVPAAFSKSTSTGLAGPQQVLGLALDAACATGEHQLQLEIIREEQEREIVVDLPASPSFSPSFPQAGKKSSAYLKSIAEQLVATQEQRGRWKPGVGGDADVYTAAFCGLTLLAADHARYLPAIQRAIQFVRDASIIKIDAADPKVGPKSWQTAVNAIFLAEYQLATGDSTYQPQLKTCTDLLADRVSEKGTMGHHWDIPYRGGGLVIINTQAHIAWALAKKCGVAVDEEAWQRSFKEVVKSIDRKTGAIGYSSRAPGSPDIAARTGAMAIALSIADQQPGLAKKLANALATHEGRMRHAHAMSSIGLIYGFSGLRCVDADSHQQVFEKWIPYFELARSAEGPAMYFGGKRNIGGDQYLGLAPIGNATVGLMLASREGKLFIHGGKKTAWLKP